MQNKYIKSLLIVIGLFVIYTGIYLGLSIFNKQEIVSKDENILLKTFICPKTTIIYIFDNNIPICLNEDLLSASLNSKSIKITELKDELKALTSFNKYLILAINDDLVAYNFSEDNFKKNAEYKLPKGSVTAILQDSKDSNIFYVSTEIMVDSPEENKSFLYILKLDEKDNILSFSTIEEIPFIDDIKVTDITFSETPFLILKETHPFLENKNYIYDIATRKIQEPTCAENLSYINNLSTHLLLFYASEKCDTIEAGYHTWNNGLQKIDIPEVKASDLLYYSPDTQIFIENEKVVSINSKTGDKIEHFVLPKEFSGEVHIINKGSIIALKNVYLYVDIQYTENIIYRVYFRKS